MPLINEIEAIRILGSRAKYLRRIILGAWDDYLEYPSALRRVHRPGTRANIVHDHIRHRARDWSETASDAQAVEINGLFIVVVEQRLAIRFKLLDENRSPRNIPTRQVKEFRNQRDIGDLRQQLNLVGEICNLEAGYILDQLQTEIRETWIVCPSGLRANAWQFEIKDSVEATRTLPEVAPLRPSSGTSVRPKESTVVSIKPKASGNTSS